MNRPDVVWKANVLAAQSRRQPAPVLREEATLSDLLEWLVWCDPNGEWLACEATEEEAWEAITDIIESA